VRRLCCPGGIDHADAERNSQSHAHSDGNPVANPDGYSDADCDPHPCHHSNADADADAGILHGKSTTGAYRVLVPAADDRENKR
jgi:hypothetical protein